MIAGSVALQETVSRSLFTVSQFKVHMGLCVLKLEP